MAKEKNEVFQVPGTITKIQTMVHKSLRLQIDTQENISANDISRLMDLYEVLGWMTFISRENKSMIKPEDLVDLPVLDISKFDMEKSPSKRLRDVLFIYHKQKGGDPKEFDNWYVREMSKVTEHYKNQLES